MYWKQSSAVCRRGARDATETAKLIGSILGSGFFWIHLWVLNRIHVGR